MSDSTRSIVAFLWLALALTGCQTYHGEKHADADQSPGYILYSPNGEPLNGGTLGKPTCQKALSGWFDRLAGQNGRVSREMFLSDAHVQFHRMDIDHNGYIVSEELDRFREPYRQQPPAKSEQADDEKKQGEKGGHKGASGKSHDGGSGGALTDTQLFDPVMSADTNLDFRVTPDEFLKQAQDSFAKLDSNHDGFLDRAEIMTLCEQKK